MEGGIGAKPGRAAQRFAVGMLCAASLALGGCSLLQGGSLAVRGNEGEVCLPPADGRVVQLGGVLIADVGENITTDRADAESLENMRLEGAYLAPVADHTLVGFDLVEDTWREQLPPGSILLDAEQPLTSGEEYTLVLITSVVDEQQEATLARISFHYFDNGFPRVATVPDSAVVRGAGEVC